ncbi:hypothetical protein EVAR_50435_1 [Eumeta japonica]|uniref:Uncharacterized protein n=1 Tax=Eumeta variegata TaxID=151549 RepID=A0A4C1XU19_EUMVA|nr:hypothetical protein EVAR_50435_1 [Eumeta japonica]
MSTSSDGDGRSAAGLWNANLIKRWTREPHRPHRGCPPPTICYPEEERFSNGDDDLVKLSSVHLEEEKVLSASTI